MSDRSGALAGLRVVDCSRLIAGGVLAAVLADHGADVIKVENPRGQILLRQLVRRADVLVESFVPGTFETWGLGWDVLSADNPRLVFARVSGWGQDGPYRERPGFGTMSKR